MAVSKEEYKQLLARERGRAGVDRDTAVRNANIAAGYGSSTAERFLHEPAAAGGGGQTRKTSPYTLPRQAPRPTARPDTTKTGSVTSSPLRHVGGAGSAPANFAGGTASDILSRANPDLAPSPNPYQMGSPVDPRQGIGAFQGPPMPRPPWASPDLAPSPNPFQMGSPVNPLAGTGAFQGPPWRHPALGGNQPVMGLGAPNPMGSTSPILGGNRPVIDVNKLFGY